VTKPWLVRNRWAFAVIVLAVALIAATVVYPTWWRNKGYLQPARSVAFGESTDVDGVAWRLTNVTLPAAASYDEDIPPDTRSIAYALSRKIDGKNAAPPDMYGKCAVSFVGDGGQRWLSQPVPFAMYRWQEDQGFAPTCGKPGPLLVMARVPSAAHIVAVDLLLSTKVEEGVEMAPDPSRVTTVIRFRTD
jgi:hypothetical protein